MVASVFEVHQCPIHLDTAQHQLAERGETFGTVNAGCMIEILSAAVTVGSILKLVDFIPVGTNDLIQYVLSADRSDDSVSHLYQPDHPVVLKTIQHIIRTANRVKKSASIYGEMAGDTASTRILLGVGLHCSSMSPSSLLAMKGTVLYSDMERLRHETAKSLRNDDPEKLEKLFKAPSSISVAVETAQ